MKVLPARRIATALMMICLAGAAPPCRAQTGMVRARVLQPVDARTRITLRGNVSPFAQPEFDQGAAPDGLPMDRMLLVLQRSTGQEAALRQLLDDQQVSSSPQFHQWLTPEQFGQQFGPADADIQAVTDWLTSQGFQVTQVSAGRTVIEFSGTAGLVRQALGTQIHKYRMNGEDYWANASDPQVPAALAPVVAGFASLNNFPRRPLHVDLGTFRRSKATGEVQPLFSIPVTCSNGNSGCYYFALGPADFATIYNIAPLWSAGNDGTGQTIAVVGETNINPQDVADFRSMFSLPANTPNIILNGPDPGILASADEPEADLDVEWSGAVAKGATIDFVVSESTETTAGIDLSALYIVDNNLAPVMSESYGACEAQLGAGGNQFYSTLWEQAAAQGITVLMAAGDSGSAGCDSANSGETFAQYGLGVSGLASTPFNVAVGGTDFNVNADNALAYWSLTNTLPSQASAKSYIPETTWNDTCAASGLAGCTAPASDGVDLVAGSGGPSSCTSPTGTFPDFTCSGVNPKPSWQSGAGVPNDGARDIPDLSFFAGNGFHYTFYVTCEMDANVRQGGSSTSCDLNSPYTDFQGGSGTSASVQVFAGIMAMVDQKYGRQGNANYVLYPMAAANGASCNSSTAPVTNSSCIFYDITAGNNSVICKGGTPNCSNTSTALGQYGIMSSGGTPAYQTTSGYDLATGLGSVNAANLVNNWRSNFTTTTTTLSLSTSPATNPIALTHGQPVNFTITVAAGSATPSGDASLIAQTGSGANGQTGIGPFALSGGSAAGSTIMLPGGSYNVTAHYAGNGTYAASDSTPGIPVMVGKESSQTKISLVTFDPATGAPSYGGTTAAYGSPYVLRMDVTNSSDQLCAPVSSTGEQLSSAYPCPTGALTVSPAPIDENPPAGTIPGSYKLNSQGYAEDEPIQQPPGQYSFVANYAGDNSYAASVSSPLPFTIAQALTTTTIIGLPSSTSNPNAGFTATVNTQSNGIAPTGTIQVLVNGAPFGSPFTVLGIPYAASTGTYASGSSNVNLQSLPVGSETLAVQYSGDKNYATSTSTPVTVNVMDYTVTANPTTINISAPGQSGSSTVTFTPENGFTGTVSLLCSTGFVGVDCTISPASLVLNGTTAVSATLTVTTTGPVNAVLHAPPPAVPSDRRLPVEWLWGLAGLMVLMAVVAFCAPRRNAPVRLFATALVVGAVWIACGGGGGGGSSTPPVTAPGASLQPTTLTFAQQNVGSISASQTVTLTNVGTAALGISGIVLGGTNSADFAQTSSCSSTLPAGSNCALTVTFTPTAPGTRTASISVSDNATGSPQTVTLTGTGAPTSAVTLSPGSLTFGPENINLTTAPQTVTLSNSGSATLIISQIGFANGDWTDFGQSNNCGNSVPAGANCQINVTYSPHLFGAVSTDLAFTDNASGSPQYLTIKATAVGPITPAGNYGVNVDASSAVTYMHGVQVIANVQ